MKKIIGLIIIIIAIIFFWSYGSKTGPSTPETPAAEGIITTPPPPPSGGPASTSPATTAGKEFTVLGSNYSFTPNTLEVVKGDRVKVIFKNANGFHDFRLDEFNVATKQIKSGESETVEFVADKTGAFEYYCSVGNHRTMGMKGTLTVK